MIQIKLLTRSIHWPIIYGIALAILVDFLYLSSYLNQSFLKGGFKQGFQFDSSDTVVVTGGSNGLGRDLLVLLSLKGIKNLVSLDVRDSSYYGNFEIDGVEFVECDIGSADQVKKACDYIALKYKTVTLLINNAGIANDKTLLELSEEEVKSIVDVNLLGQIWTLKNILPGMIKENRGYIVTISSVLGKIGPAGVSAYSASKAGLIALHDSLSHELAAHKGIKTLLVTPGQMEGPMFEGVSTPNSFIAPIVPHMKVAQVIVEAIEKGTVGEISFPLYARILPIISILPQSVVELTRWWFGMDKVIASKKQSFKSEPISRKSD